MRSGDDITLVLSLDGQEFELGMKGAGRILDRFERQAKSAKGGVGELDTSIEGILGTTRDFTIILATAEQAIGTLVRATFGWQKTIMDAAGEIERLEVMMRGMSTATTQAGRDLDALNASKFITDFAQNAPFRMEALTDTFVKFRTVGMDPMNGSMKALTDAVAHFGGNSDILHRASVAIQQMTGKGVISMEELRQQLGEAVPSAMQIMARSMGMTVAELVGKIETGTVQSQTAIRKMLAEMAQTFDGSGVRMMTTWNGIVQSMETRWKLFLKDIAGDTGDGTSYFNTMKQMMDELSQWMVGSEAKQFASEISNALSELSQGLKTMAIFLYENRSLILQVGKLMVFYFVTSRVAMGIAAITTAMSRMGTSTGILGMALGDYRSHMDKVGQRNEQFRNQLSSLDGSFTRTTARAGNLISNLPRLGMAFMSLAGPIGMGISIIASAGYALLGLAGDLDGLADSIIRTRGMIASNADLDKLRDSSEELQAEYASNHDAMTRAIHTARRTTSDAIRQEAQSTVEAMMARNGVIKNQLNEYGVAIEEGQRGIQFRLVEGSKATTDRMIQGFFDPISAQYNATRIQLEQMRVEANGDASKLQDIHNQVVQAIETAYNQKREIIDREERLLEERRRSLGNVSTEIGQQKLAEIEAALLALESKRTEIESIKAESIVTTNMANEFIVKPPRGVPQAVKESKRALEAMQSLVNGFAIRMEQVQAKADEANPHLEGLEERISQLRESIKPSEASMFDQLANQARETATELGNLERLKRAERSGEQAYMQMLSQTASALGQTEEGRLARMRVQKLELAEQVREYEELLEKMKVAGVDPAQVQQYAAALQEYHAESMNQIVIDAESSWASMMREMREFKADWASMWKGASDTAIDEIVRFAKEGKFEFGNLVDYVLEQMLRIELQKSLVQPMSEVMNMGKFALSGMFGSTSGYTQGFASQISTTLPTTASANGNIMTQWGPAALNRYEKGGIANSPQISIFGEGRTPEAYVPLPDGRSIPVTMQGGGGGAPNIQFNLINQSGQPVEAEQAGGRFDGESYVLDVVLKAVNRPGSFRDSMKGAFK